jgi:transposase
MKEILIMSYRETGRLKVISRIEFDELTVVDAAESIHISERQMYRILKRYHTEGEAGLLHRLRGRTSNVAFPKDERQRVLRLYRERYSDYGPTLFTEKLDEHHDIQISHQTVTRWLIKAGLWSGTRKKRPHRKKRDRRACIGSLVQFDGSHHAWFEDRGPMCCLLVAIDDASSRIFVRFAPSEDTLHVLSFWKEYLLRFGIPASVYTDFGSVYYDDQKKQPVTQYGRAMKKLEIQCIYAHSPQAKGRVERVNRTLQDRLLKALREQNISTIDEANRFLDAGFLDSFNRRFSSPDSLTDIHRSAAGIDLTSIFCFEANRHVYNDWTITWNAQFLQLLSSHAPLPPPRSKVVVRQWLDGSLHVFWNDNELSFVLFKTKNKPQLKKCLTPAADHPWRRKPLGKLRNSRKSLASYSSIGYDSTHSKNGRVVSNNRKGRPPINGSSRSTFTSGDPSP